MGKAQEDVTSRITQAKVTFNQNKKLIMSKNTKLETKKVFVKSYIWDMGTYGSET